jgi:hypothetical protein
MPVPPSTLAEANRRLHEVAHTAGSLLCAARIRLRTGPRYPGDEEVLERLRLSYELLQRAAEGSDEALAIVLRSYELIDGPERSPRATEPSGPGAGA